jgi:hypothetical protein
MDLQPPAPLSGEWAGESIAEIFGDPDPTQEILDAYEQSYGDAYWDEVTTAAAAILPDDDSTLE